MKFAFATLALAAGASAQISEASYQGRFLAWSQEHGKKYETAEVFQRFENFKATDAKIQKHNAGNDTWFMRHNQFSDLTKEEFLAKYTGFDASAHGQGEIYEGEGDVNADIDWVAKGAVTPVKDQGQCGSCWAFSTTGGIEGAVQIKTGTLTSLSEQQLVDCASSQGNQGCNGGLMDSAFKYVQQNGGLCSEADYRYTARDGTCKASSCSKHSPITGFKDVRAGDESGLLSALANGPVSIAVDAGAFQSYGGGVLSACSGKSLDHGVLLVGYDGTNWKVKNSWGTSWGESGYIRMPYGKDCCGMADAASQPTA